MTRKHVDNMPLTQPQLGRDTKIMMQHKVDIVVSSAGTPSVASAYKKTTIRYDQARKVVYRALNADDKLCYSYVTFTKMNRTGNRGGCLVKVKQDPQQALQVVDSNALRPRPAGCRRSILASVGG